ncbi:hypothetical protein C2E23DRAFT_720835 [Lenzites betulinus]|nr:hypothetical protein C2E23DRAFT_720835 [Lenzites betulinus]
MLSVDVRRSAAHPGCRLRWDEDDVALAAQLLSSADFIVKPNELHLAFDIGPLRSHHYSRFTRLSPRDRPAPRRALSKPFPSASALSRSSTVSSMTMTLSADVGVLLTRHVRRESTYIVWGGLLAFEPPAERVPLRAVLVKIAVDEDGGEDLREHARHYEALAERGVYVGYYGLFGDKIGSMALVVEDLGEDSPRSASP